jgi:sulfatase maturation enzyme AslB (radical SAM superfamily)
MKDTFCVLPYIHAVYNPYDSSKEDCSVLPCCRYDFMHETENSVSHEPIKNSEIFQRLQTELSSGVQSKGCWRCWKDESIGIRSYRQANNETFSDVIESGEYAEKKLRFLEIVPSNACNLACLSCNSVLSSKWVPIDNFIASDKKKNTIEFTDWRTLDLSGLTYLKLMGGEPMFLKDNLALLQHLSVNGMLKNIDLLVITNLMNPLTDKWKDLFSECKSVMMCVSIDAIGPLNEYIRADSKWDRVESNLQAMLEFSKNIDMSVFVNTVISIYNVNKSLEIENYFKNINVQASQDLTSYPLHIDSKRLPTTIKKQLLDSNCLSKTVIDNLNFVDQKDGLIEEFFQHTDVLDKYHKRKFEDYNPEMASILRGFHD